ncbi:unnamed protein product [Closterium sp. NIES-64]|nr:unnamed protein product [Closterium sp. NIES-64]
MTGDNDGTSSNPDGDGQEIVTGEEGGREGLPLAASAEKGVPRGVVILVVVFLDLCAVGMAMSLVTPLIMELGTTSPLAPFPLPIPVAPSHCPSPLPLPFVPFRLHLLPLPFPFAPFSFRLPPHLRLTLPLPPLNTPLFHPPPPPPTPLYPPSVPLNLRPCALLLTPNS